MLSKQSVIVFGLFPASFFCRTRGWCRSGFIGVVDIEFRHVQISVGVQLGQNPDSVFSLIESPMTFLETPDSQFVILQGITQRQFSIFQF